MEKKRGPNAKMIMDIVGKAVEVDIYVDPAFKALRYELTCQQEIHPMDAAFALWLIVKGICDEAGVNPSTLMVSSQPAAPDGSHIH